MNLADVWEFRDASLYTLRNNINLCQEILADHKVAISVKLKWVHASIQNCAVLCKIIKDMGWLKDHAGKDTDVNKLLDNLEYFQEEVDHLQRQLEMQKQLAERAAERGPVVEGKQPKKWHPDQLQRRLADIEKKVDQLAKEWPWRNVDLAKEFQKLERKAHSHGKR